MADLATWASSNTDHIVALLAAHIQLVAFAVGGGVLLAVPIGLLCVTYPGWNRVMVVITSFAFAIPSLALYILLVPAFGISQLTAVLPLTLYATALLMRSVVAGLQATPMEVHQAAEAMGIRGLHRATRIDLFVAMPHVIGGLRVATVSIISMATLVSVLGMTSLGDLFVDGLRRFYPTPIIVGIVLVLVLAAVVEVLLIVLQRLLTPWSKGVTR